MDVDVECSLEGTFTLRPQGWIGLESLADVEPVHGTSQDIIAEFIRSMGRPCSVKTVAAGCGMSLEAARSALRRGTVGSKPVFTHVKGGLYGI